MITVSQIFGLLSVAVATAAYVPYVRATIKGVNRPHIFTWVIWGLLTSIAFAVQVAGGAGPGAWAAGITALFSILIALLSIRYGERHVTRSDWIMFIAALFAIPIWVATKNPAYAAVWVTAIDGSAYYPTIRKSWRQPYQEMVFTHVISNVKHILSLFALRQFNIATTLYPVALVAFNSILIVVILTRRRGGITA